MSTGLQFLDDKLEKIQASADEQAKIAKDNGNNTSYILYSILAGAAGLGGKKVWDRDPKPEDPKKKKSA